MPESSLQRDAVKLLERSKLYVVNTWGTPLSHSGVPDLITCCDGGFVGFETKYLEGKTSRAQDFHIGLIRKAGGLVFVPKTLDEIERVVAELRGSMIHPWCSTCNR